MVPPMHWRLTIRTLVAVGLLLFCLGAGLFLMDGGSLFATPSGPHVVYFDMAIGQPAATTKPDRAAPPRQHVAGTAVRP